jgi:uncharacterized protein (DUF58 family)
MRRKRVPETTLAEQADRAVGFVGLGSLGGRVVGVFGRLWPRARRRVGTSICGEGLYYLAFVALVFFVALVGEVNLLMVLAGMFVGPAWFGWRLVARTLRGLEVRRRMPRSICAGDLLLVDLELVNPRRRLGSWAVEVEERIRSEGSGAGTGVLRPSVYYPYVPAGQSRCRTYRGRLPQRGRYRFARAAVSTRFPFGFFRCTVLLGPEDTLVVYPRLGRLTPRWLARHRESFEGSHRRERRHGRTSGDFFGVRPWRSGDERRHIDWRSSARHGSLVVRQFERHRTRDVAILVNLWQPKRPSAEHLANVELAVSFAATVVADTCRKGGGNLLVGTTAGRAPSGGWSWVRGPASAALEHSAMENLAVAEASPEDRLADLLDRALGTIDPGTEVVLVTTQAVDLTDAERFAVLWRDPARRSLAGGIRVISTADEGLAEYFHV